jgi:hypothetical protein
MNFDDFIDRYQIYTNIDQDLREIVTISKDTLRQMLTDLYSTAYKDGAAGETLVRLLTDRT